MGIVIALLMWIVLLTVPMSFGWQLLVVSVAGFVAGFVNKKQRSTWNNLVNKNKDYIS